MTTRMQWAGARDAKGSPMGGPFPYVKELCPAQNANSALMRTTAEWLTEKYSLNIC